MNTVYCIQNTVSSSPSWKVVQLRFGAILNLPGRCESVLNLTIAVTGVILLPVLPESACGSFDRGGAP